MPPKKHGKLSPEIVRAANDRSDPTNRYAAEVTELNKALALPDYANILSVCNTEDVTPNDILVFLGAMTDKKGHSVDRPLDKLARFTLDRFVLQQDKGLRQVPKGVTQAPPEYYRGQLRFMLAQFAGKQATSTVAEAGKLISPTQPLIEFHNSSVGGDNNGPVRLLDRLAGLTHDGMTMYFRLLLHLGNTDMFLDKDNPIPGFQHISYAERDRHRELFRQKRPGLYFHLGRSPADTA